MTHLEDVFARLLPVIEADLQTVLSAPESYPPLYYQMLHYHMGWIDQTGQPADTERGKRIRPAVALMVCEAVCGDYRPARPAAAAVELIHNFSLLHDDIQDRSPTRRNRPTAWMVWGEKQGINAGDALFALAHLAIPRLAAPDSDPAVLYRMLCILDETCLDLTRGQHLDMLFENQDHVTTDEYLNMIAGKTAALSAAAAQMGAIAAGASEQVVEHFRAFGHNMGLAFQVLDDVLDIWGDPRLTGKEAAVDIHDRKKSLPVLYGLERSVALRTLYADAEPFAEQTVQSAIRLLDEVNARGYAEELARHYSRETVAHLEAASPAGPTGQALYELVDTLLHRSR